MEELPPDTIEKLCKLSEDDIYGCDPSELHHILVIAIQQIEENLRELGVSDQILKTSYKRLELQVKVNQLSALETHLKLINIIEFDS